MPAPDLSTVPAFYHDYIRQVQEEHVQDAVAGRFRILLQILPDLDEESWNFSYAPGKWTLKELIQHILDGERIFSYRALCISRGDQHPLPGFDENAYAENSAANERSGNAILEELRALDISTSCLFSSFSNRQLAAQGIANGAPVSVNAIGYILTGHALHHTRIVQERYLDRDYEG